jgi:hypothetical protein
MRKMLVLVAAAGVLVLAFNGTAAADSAYHTERLALSGVSGAPGGGMVVNAHANGPNVYAHEIYTLRHSVPGTYQVVLNIYTTSLSCDGTPIEVETAQISTNAAGNGRADAKFTPEDAGELRGSTVSIRWTVSGPATYATQCTVVTLD